MGGETLQSYTERIKSLTLYEAVAGDRLSKDLLTETPGSSRVTAEMAHFIYADVGVRSTLKGYFKEHLGVGTAGITSLYRITDGWSTEQSIKAESAVVARETAQQQTANGKPGKVTP